MPAKIYYDDDCGMCRKTVHWIRVLLKPEDTIFLPAQNDDQVLVVMIQKNSWIFETEDGQRYFRYAGFLQTLKRSWLRQLLPFFQLPPVAWVGDRTYCFVANHRPTKCEIPKNPER